MLSYLLLLSLHPCRWVTSRWSECSATCGSGFRYRQITCQQVKANGSVVTVLAGACMHQDRPAGRKPCTGYSCTAGTAQTREQVGHRVCRRHQCNHSVVWTSVFSCCCYHTNTLTAKMEARGNSCNCLQNSDLQSLVSWFCVTLIQQNQGIESRTQSETQVLVSECFIT